MCLSWVFTTSRRIQMLFSKHQKVLHVRWCHLFLKRHVSFLLPWKILILFNSPCLSHSFPHYHFLLLRLQIKKKIRSTLLLIIHLNHSCLSTSATQTTNPTSDDSTLPIALRKGAQSTRNTHPIYNFLSYHLLSPSYFSFVFALPPISVPKNVYETLDYPRWRQAMITGSWT